jgi:glycosyltransferase involved in cell wall biosynthesis
VAIAAPTRVAPALNPGYANRKAMRRPLLISHDLTYSGAPVALLALAQALRRLGENPIVLPLHGGPLAQAFRDSGIELVDECGPSGLSFVIANTVLAVEPALRLKRFGIPVAAWLHESEYFFRTLNISPQACGLGNLDVVLAPSRFQLLQLAPFLPPGGGYQLRNVVRQEWYRVPGDESMLAVCGAWEVRKGQARLLELAARAAADCRFKFIGADRPPGSAPDDATLSPHRFLGPVKPEDAKREIAAAGAFVSCAEAETQNLCAIEALIAGRPALLSDIDAHRILAALIPNVLLFDRTSAPSFGAGLAKLRVAMADEHAARMASETAQALFGPAAFDRRLGEILRVLRREAGAAAEVGRYQDA